MISRIECRVQIHYSPSSEDSDTIPPQSSEDRKEPNTSEADGQDRGIKRRRVAFPSATRWFIT